MILSVNLDKIVVNASPIISLARIGLADLLLNLSAELVVPRGVFREISAHPCIDPAAKWLQDKETSVVQAVEVPLAISEWNLGKGESEVIAFAQKQEGFVAAIDDKAAKRCAEASGIRVRGTIALILYAKRKRIIPDAGQVLLKLRANGFRISESLLSDALHLADEV